MKAMGIFLAFMLMFILGIFAVGFTSGITEPTAGTTAGNQYANLTKVISISNSGLYAVLLILIAAMLISAVLYLGSSITRKKGY